MTLPAGLLTEHLLLKLLVFGVHLVILTLHGHLMKLMIIAMWLNQVRVTHLGLRLRRRRLRRLHPFPVRAAHVDDLLMTRWRVRIPKRPMSRYKSLPRWTTTRWVPCGPTRVLLLPPLQIGDDCYHGWWSPSILVHTDR